MVTVDQVREVALSFPRAYEALVRHQVKFRVGQIVFVALSRDETRMGCGFPKEERPLAVEAEPEKFEMPRQSDLRYNWIVVRLDAIDAQELYELVTEAWRMCVPKRVAAEHLGP
jgi:hypothetical protein